MKKLLVLLFAVLVMVALVACGDTETSGTPGTSATPTTSTNTSSSNGTSTTTAPTVTTGNTVTTTTPTPVSTTTPTTTAPRHAGMDILNGDFDNMAINPSWNTTEMSINACAFENHHAVLDFRWSLVVNFLSTPAGVFEELVLTDPDAANPEDNATNWMMHDIYEWVVIIDGVEHKITNFSCLNDQTSGFVRMDLGDWTPSEEIDEDGYHAYDIELIIYEAGTQQVAFWAYLTDPEMNGPYFFKEPEPIVMVEDPNRDPSHVAIPVTQMSPQSGPAGFASETYDLLFDGRPNSKLCTTNLIDPTIVKFDTTKHIVSYSLVNANDDESYPERTPVQWKLSGSNDGNTWIEIDTQNLTETNHTNYAERNFKLSEGVDYMYIKFENAAATDRYQLADIIFYTTADYAEQ